MSTATLIGLVAGALTTTSWLPQVFRAFRTRSTKDFAWSWFALFGVGVGGWLVYGIVAASPSVIATNALTLALVLGLGWLKLRQSNAGITTASDHRELSHSTAADDRPEPRQAAADDLSGLRPSAAGSRREVRRAASASRRERQNRSPAHIPAP
jgi:MtN3 and saliva related transmembrane protein